MFPDFDVRLSDSPLVERVWRSYSEGAGSFTSISAVCWSMVVSKFNGRIALSIHGPETGANSKDFPTEELEWFGIDFKLGTFMPHIPPTSMVGRNRTLPQAAKNTFWLGDSAWQFPNYENADTFVNRLGREGLLTNDPTVTAIQEGLSPKMSLRSVQYRFLLSTGLTQRTIKQIERARYAVTLLKQGVSIFDAVYEAGYSDQAHLTRSLKHFIGHTPTEIMTNPIIGLYQSM
jgi:AraC-like DNA-binding protein